MGMLAALSSLLQPQGLPLPARNAHNWDLEQLDWYLHPIHTSCPLAIGVQKRAAHDRYLD
jgi:hypothetical protein